MPTNKPGYMQEYYNKNRDSVLKHVNEVVKCECKVISTRGNIARHRKSSRHLKRMQKIKTNLSGYYI